MNKIITAIQRLMGGGKKDNPVEKSPQTHEFTHQVWGDAFYYEVLDEGMKLEGHGFRRGIEVGDYVIIGQDGGKRTTRYKVDKIRYCNDPSDMWFGTLSFAPRTFTPDGVQVGE